MVRRVVLEFPVDLPEECLQDKDAVRKGKERIVLELLRKGTVSQGKAAELLEIDRHTLFDLMAEHEVPVVDMSAQELREELSKDVFKKGKK